jgi:hypothetical protein
VSGEIRAVTKVVADIFVGRHGFTRHGRRLSRGDGLWREVIISPFNSTIRGAYRFDVLMRLGLVGLTSISSRKGAEGPWNSWVVMASACEVLRKTDPRVQSFELTGNHPEDLTVLSRVGDMMHTLALDFLLKYETADDLLDLVLNGEEEFRRLDIQPWNRLSRLELGCLYLEFMGESIRARQLAAVAENLSHEEGVNYFPDKLRRGMQAATEQRIARGSGMSQGSGPPSQG